MTEKYKHAYEIIENWERVEERCGGGMWGEPLSDPERYALATLNSPNVFRLKPTPRKVPWGPEDVRPGMVFRTIKYPNIAHAWLARDPVGVAIAAHAHESFQALREHWEYSLDGITWAKCEKDEVPQ